MLYILIVGLIISLLLASETSAKSRVSNSLFNQNRDNNEDSQNNGAAVRNSFINEFVFGNKDQALRNLIAEARKSSAHDDFTDAYIISQLASKCTGRLSEAHTSQTEAIA